MGSLRKTERGDDPDRRDHSARPSAAVTRNDRIGEAADSLSGLAPLGRVGEVEETSEAVLYLPRALEGPGLLI